MTASASATIECFLSLRRLRRALCSVQFNVDSIPENFTALWLISSSPRVQRAMALRRPTESRSQLQGSSNGTKGQTTCLNVEHFRPQALSLSSKYLELWHAETCASPKCAMTAEAGGSDVDQMRLSCCMEDGGRPSGGGLQDQPSSRPALLGDKLPGGERTG